MTHYKWPKVNEAWIPHSQGPIARNDASDTIVSFNCCFFSPSDDNDRSSKQFSRWTSCKPARFYRSIILLLRFFPHHCDLHVRIIHPSWRSNNQDGRTHRFLFVYSFVCLFFMLDYSIFFFKGFFFFCNLLADLTAIPGIYKCISGHRIKYWLHVFTRKSFENWFMWKTTHLNVENFENEQKSHWKRSITNIRTRKYTFSSMKLRKVN